MIIHLFIAISSALFTYVLLICSGGKKSPQISWKFNKATVVSVTKTRHSFSFSLSRVALGHGGRRLAEVT